MPTPLGTAPTWRLRAMAGHQDRARGARSGAMHPRTARRRVGVRGGSHLPGRDRSDSTSTGPGLAIPVSLVDAMGGTAGIDTGPGGTTFDIRLPTGGDALTR